MIVERANGSPAKSASGGPRQRPSASAATSCSARGIAVSIRIRRALDLPFERVNVEGSRIHVEQVPGLLRLDRAGTKQLP